MAMSWDEDWEDETEDTEEELDYLLSEDEPESTDEEIWDRDIGARLENEWEPKEDDEDADFSATNDPVLCCRRIVTENPFDRRAPISEAIPAVEQVIIVPQLKKVRAFQHMMAFRRVQRLT